MTDLPNLEKQLADARYMLGRAENSSATSWRDRSVGGRTSEEWRDEVRRLQKAIRERDAERTAA